MQPIDVRDSDALLLAVMPSILAAARLELGYFNQGLAVERKDDKTPVTIADQQAEDILVAALQSHAPTTPIIAEEAVSAGHRPELGRMNFLVDALDGTHMFIRGKPQFSINIGLIENGSPRFGVIYGPCTGELYATRADGFAYHAIIPAEVERIQLDDVAWSKLSARQPDRDNLLAFNSRKTGGASVEFLDALDVQDIRPLGSSLKFCRLARGDGDLYVRLGNTSEWDTAAGQAILEAAGGHVFDLDGRPLTYGHADRTFKNPHFIAWGRTPLAVDQPEPGWPQLQPG